MSYVDPLDWLRLSLTIQARADTIRTSTPTRLYVVHDATADAFKIGIGQRPKHRLRNLQVGNAHPLELVLDIACYAAVEGLLHGWLESELVSGEWFRCSDRTMLVLELLRFVADHERDVERDEPDAFDADFALSLLTERADEFVTPEPVRSEAVSPAKGTGS